MVYVISKNGHPLMPTMRHGKVRRMLKENKATVVKRCPFTIQLLYEAEENVQEISLGVDAGSKHIGLSATTEKIELYAAEVELRTDITKLLSQRREMRRSRRNRKTRHRKPRFYNRAHSKKKGWLSPTIRQKIECHFKAVEEVHKILPITNVIVETATFDLQKLKADMEGLKRPKRKEYQEGEQLGFLNAREYILSRDGYRCQCCKGKSKDPVLEVHHIESRQTGGDAPNNLVTLCKTCHDGYHRGVVALPEGIKRGRSFRDAAFMGIMRWAFYDELKERYPNVRMTYGYITKHTRIKNRLEKSHIVDARCISGHPLATPAREYFYKKKVRRHNRQIHKMTITKGGVRKRNQASYLVKGFRLFDKVEYKGQECFVFGRRSTGCFDVRKLNGEKISAGVSYKKLKFLETANGYVTERRAAPPRMN